VIANYQAPTKRNSLSIVCGCAMVPAPAIGYRAT